MSSPMTSQITSPMTGPTGPTRPTRPTRLTAGLASSEVRTGADLVVTTLTTPMGLLSVAVDADGVVHRALFGAASALALPDARRVAPEAVPGPVAGAVARYLAGELTALDEVTVRQPGGPFRQAAWEAMRTIPPGETVTYTELAELSGRPAAVRAAGSACAKNLVAPFVPCHRVVRSDGTLGGYAYGLDVKRALLEHERRHAHSR